MAGDNVMNIGDGDFDGNQDTPRQYGIRSIPTLLVFNGGKVMGRIADAAPKTLLEDTLTQAL